MACLHRWYAGMDLYSLCNFCWGRSAEHLSSAPEGVQSAFRTMRLIVFLVGWAIYPLGYVFGYAGKTKLMLHH